MAKSSISGTVVDAARLDKTKKAIATALKRVEDLKNSRTDTSASIAEVRAKMVTLGVPKAAFDAALKYKTWDEDQRRGYDAAYALAREAMGLPFDAQGELFIPSEEEDEQADLED